MEKNVKQVLIQNGQAVVEDVPPPQPESGTIVVRVLNSCISPGTEGSGMKESAEPLWKRALKNPGKVKQALHMLATSGFSHTRSVVQGKLQSGYATGYSAAGRVMVVGAGIDDIKEGDIVACAGAQCAHHAEIIRVPRNLAVQVPDGLDASHASTVALGAIAMQGVRRAKPSLGENFVVIGLGVIGQLTAQFLKTNGCRVIGADLDPERSRIAMELGMDIELKPDDGPGVENVMRLTGGLGADGVIITASTSSHEVLSTAFQMCRRKGRVVLVGVVGMTMNREDIYAKELDFFISTSYGPGRYDNNYEEKGHDYPPSYVRWTENRNMWEYLRLLADGRINIEPLISATHVIDDAPTAYAAIADGEHRPMITLLSYPENSNAATGGRLLNPSASPSQKSVLNLALAGAGGFAHGMHLPNLSRMKNLYCLHAVMSRTGHNAKATAKQFGAKYATTDYREIVSDADVDAVLICTRHDSHAKMTLDALRAGKHVIVEKPLALDRDEMSAVEEFYNNAGGESGAPVLLTGFNRRFSKFSRRIAEIIAGRKNPIIINYRMNAGYIPLDSWLHNEQGGGRNIGEACHIYDLFTFFTNAKAVAVDARSITAEPGYYSNRDNFIATVSFDDGSIATLTYTALGSKDFPKETMEIYCDGKILSMCDYKKLTVYGTNLSGIESSAFDKGHREELEEFARAVKGGGAWPIPLWQQLQAMEIAFRVEEMLTR